MEERLPVTSKNIFREDVVRHTTHRNRIGIVLENGNDSESSSEYEEDEDRVEEGHVLVSWYPKGHEEEIEENLLQVVDRSLLHGDVVRWVDPSKGSMKGCVSGVNLNVSIRIVGSHQFLLKDVDVNDLIPLQKYYHGLAIALGAWIGVVHEVLLRLTLKLRNGARCVVEGEQINMLIDNTDQRDEDSPFYCQLFYPGQSLAGTSRVFRDVRWINGPRPVFSGSQRISCVVEEVTVSGLRVHWQERGYNTDHAEPFLAPPDTIITEDKLANVVAFDRFNKTSIQIGDKAFYTLKDSDVHKIKNPPTQGVTGDDSSEGFKEQPENKKSKHSSRDKELGENDIEGDKYEDNVSTSSEDSADDEDSDHGNSRESRPSASVTSRRSETRHMGATAAPRAHATRKRRQFRRKKKKHQIPVRLVPGERVCVEVEATSKLLTVTWQNGVKEEDISSTQLLPVLHVDDLEFFPGDFVIDKTLQPFEAGYGVVQKVDSAQRTCRIKWLNRADNQYDDCVSVYDIGDHPDYSFRPGDVVVRLIDEPVSSMEQGESTNVTPSCGQVLFVDNDGKINVLWADQTVSALLPQNLFVVQTEDWSSTGSPHSSSDEEWETTSDISTENEQAFAGMNPLMDMQILDDIAQRSLAALNSNSQGVMGNEGNEEVQPQDDSADTQEELAAKEPDGKGEDNMQPVAMSNSDVKVRPPAILNENGTNIFEGFGLLEEIPSSHKFAATTFQPINQRQFNSAIRKEISAMKSHLPDGVFVRGFECRLDLYSIMIKGPAGTPYEDGVFIFDLQLPPDYPKSPPVVHYLSQCTERLNPNLYEDGTVCVSLLGTWNGKGSETWTSKSNLCQLILSLQGLILCEEPYFNEAGYEKHKGSTEGTENSRMYNEMVIIKLLQSLDRLVKNPPETFRNEIRQHMEVHLPRLFHRIYKWLGQYAPKDFLEKHSLPSDDGPLFNPDFPLLPLSYGFCITLLRNLKALENTSQKNNI